MPALADTPYRKCPSTDFLEEVDSVLEPQGKGESSVGEWEVEAQSCRSMESTVCLGSKVPSEGDWCRMFVCRRPWRVAESSGGGSPRQLRAWQAPEPQMCSRGSGEPLRFMNRETACEHFYLGSRLDLKHF